MPLDCTGKITANIVLDCENTPVAGLETNIVIINKDDIDYANCTFDPVITTRQTALKLFAGKVGFSISGVKQSNQKSSELAPVENMPNKWKHEYVGQIFNNSAENKMQLANLGLGGKYVVVIEQLWKGVANKDAFEVLGYKSGLILTESKNSSIAGDNTWSLKLSSEAKYEEPKPPYTLLQANSYAATKTAFTNLFPGTVIP